MTFKDFYMTEKFKSFVKYQDELIDVSEDPSSGELRDILKQTNYKVIRIGVTDEPNPKLYAWAGDKVLHQQIMKDVVPFEYGAEVENLKYGRSNWDLEVLKNPEAIKKKIKKHFPRVKNIDYFGRAIEL